MENTYFDYLRKLVAGSRKAFHKLLRAVLPEDSCPTAAQPQTHRIDLYEIATGYLVLSRPLPQTTVASLRFLTNENSVYDMAMEDLSMVRERCTAGFTKVIGRMTSPMAKEGCGTAWREQNKGRWMAKSLRVVTV